MKSMQLLYPQHSVLDQLQLFLRIKKYNVLSVNEKEGTIHAIKKRTFRKDLMIDLNVLEVDSIITTLSFSMSLESNTQQQSQTTADEENQLLDSIENFLQA